MKTLIFNNIERLEAERIVKTADSVIGYIANTEVFAFRGVSAWSQFKLADGQEWDVEETAANDSYLLDLDFRVSMLELGVS
ncbi:hypothetical protein V2J23_04175 [Geobacillus thermoleovorans]|uniref:hypothetical protein n=1 Tax=Geobacillus thermoleovorans TaxID=33941 RepID=UPI00345C1113